MKAPIKYNFVHWKYWFKDNDVLWVMKKEYDKDKIYNLYLKWCIKDYKDYTEEDFKNQLRIEEVKSPTSFPKFNNEQPFKIKWGGAYIDNPTILEYQWDGIEWKYKLEKIGHVHDFQPESKLELI